MSKKQNEKHQKNKPMPFFAKNQNSKKLVIQTDLRAGRMQERASKL